MTTHLCMSEKQNYLKKDSKQCHCLTITCQISILLSLNLPCVIYSIFQFRMISLSPTIRRTVAPGQLMNDARFNRNHYLT